MSKTYGRITFEIESIPYCCGLLTLGGFQESRANGWNYNGKNFNTEAEQIADFHERYRRALADYIEGGNHHSGQYIMQATFVEKYGSSLENDGQLPQLRKYLAENGWKDEVRWKNHNSGNKVVLYQYRLTNKEINEIMKEFDMVVETEDDNW